MYMTMKVGSENIRKAVNPPQNDVVAYIAMHMSSWVEVGPGIDWQMVMSSVNC